MIIETPEQFATELAKALPSQLRSVLLYGSAAAGDFVPGASNYNLLVFVDPLGMAELDAASPTVVAWSRNGHPSPLFFTPQQVANTIQAFPLELLDIERSRRILWGTDLLADAKVDVAQLRRQVEHELVGKLLKLRGRFMLLRGKPRAVTELMLESVSTFLVLFRGALRLFQEDVPTTKLEALHALAKHIEFDPSTLEQLFELKSRARRSLRMQASVSFDSYLASIESIANAVISAGTSREQ